MSHTDLSFHYRIFKVKLYMERVLSHPKLKEATYTWPGFIPSPYLTPLLQRESSLLKVERNRAMVVLTGFVGGGVRLGIWELVKYLTTGTFAKMYVIFLGIWMWQSRRL